MNIKIFLKFVLPLQVLLFFAVTKSYSQVEVDTSNMGPPSNDPSLQDFQDSLSSKGNWEQITSDEIDSDSVEGADSETLDDDIYNDYVWVPNPALIWVDWSPYCNGRWVWTYWGWQWLPYDNWGWCTYHYGRWWWHHRYGWVWSPGHRWRHAWVSWYRTGGYWGWHPIPPRIYYKHGVSVIPANKNVHNDGWVFVNKKDFTKPITKSTTIDVNKHPDIFKTPNISYKKNGQNRTDVNKNSWVDKTRIPNEKVQNRTKQNNPGNYSGPKNEGKKNVTPKNPNNSTGTHKSGNNGTWHNSGPKSKSPGNHTGSSNHSGNSNKSGNSSHSSHNSGTSKGK